MKAFPNSKFNNEDSNGMELRDYFAAKAMKLTYEFWIRDYYEFGFNGEENRDGLYQNMNLIAETAYEMADAMMEARNASI